MYLKSLCRTLSIGIWYYNIAGGMPEYGSKIRFQRSLVLLCIKREDIIINKVHAPPAYWISLLTYAILSLSCHTQ